MVRGKVFGILMIIAAIIIATAAYAEDFNPDAFNPGEELPIDVLWVKINEDTIQDTAFIGEDTLRNDELSVKVKIEAYADVEDVTVEAEIFGDDHFEISDQSDTFDVLNNTRYTRELSIDLPSIMEKDDYNLRITVAGRTGAVKVYNYLLRVSAEKNDVIIKDVTFNPDSEVKAGRALLTVVRVKNVGLTDEDSVKIKVEIPELGISATDYIDELEADDSVSSEEMYMRIPTWAETGNYQVITTVEYDEETEEIKQTDSIKIVEDEELASPDEDEQEEPQPVAKTIVTVGPESQNVQRGEGGAIYMVSITNQGSDAKSYTISVTGVETFGEIRMTPGNLLVVEGGQTKNAYVYVSAKENAQVGAHTFAIDVKAGADEKQVLLTANVIQAEASDDGAAEGWDQIKKGLEIGLIVLIVLLVILGLIIAYNKMKGDKEDDEEPEDLTGQTYY